MAQDRGGLRIGVLGPLTVTRDGAEFPALPPGQRMVLGLLAVACGSAVRLDTIIDALWGDKPPVSATVIVQTYISRLRQALGALRGTLLTLEGAGYRLNVGPEELDLLAFRRLIADARAGAGDPAHACQVYEQALDLWRGEPLVDIAALRTHPAVVALAAEHTQAVLDYADAAMACGRHERVLPQLRQLAAASPLDELSQSRLMIALAGSGRQAEALAVHEEVRHRLDEELGVFPGSALRAAHAKVLHQDTGLAAPSESELPLFQLPAAPADFTGRAEPLARLISAVAPRQVGVPIAVLSGPPGAGKTSLALQAAHTLRDRFPDGQLWVHLAGTSARPRDPGEVLGEFLRALGIAGPAIPLDISERTVCYRSRLAGRRIVVVADDAASAAQVRPLLPGTAGCALIVTSRSRLEGLDAAELIPLDVMTEQDAGALLTRLVGAERVAAERDAATSLVQACGALPLAMRIAGAKVAARPLWSLSLMVRKLTGEHERLGELESGDLSVRASIGSSYESLPERVRRGFRLLALLGSGDFAEWTVGALIGCDGREAAAMVEELTSRSLLTPLGADVTGEPRYRLHDLLRDFAAERLGAEEPGSEVTSALRRLLDGWLQLAMTAAAKLPPEPYFPPLPTEQPDVVPAAEAARLTADPGAWFTAERNSLIGVVEQACQLGWLELASHLAAQQRPYQHLQHRHDDAIRQWGVIADCATQAGNAEMACYARVRVGASLVQCGMAADAAAILDECISDNVNSKVEVLSSALEWRATSAWDMNDFTGARSAAERGVAVSQRAGYRLGECGNLIILSTALASLGLHEDAVAAGEAARAIAEELGIATCEPLILIILAGTCNLSDQHERAVRVSLRALELSEKLGDVSGEALAYGMLGDAYLGLGRYEEAAAVLLRALPIFRSHSSRRFHAVCLLKLGYTYEAMGSTEAISYLEESLRLFTELRLPRKADEARQALDRCRIALPAS
ncbi:MAG TPA: BTAD domain-containing putative transcriptional regulator [Streptosporangiaceae bacterium]|nr:BTAD domain-containing putative transcriptional regulator [Streptosporangiaceae bacterium]